MQNYTMFIRMALFLLGCRYHEIESAKAEANKVKGMNHRVFMGCIDDSPSLDAKVFMDQRNYDQYILQNEATVERILILENRTLDALTATVVVINACGWIRFWSIDHDGGLLGQFNAGQNANDVVGAMCTDKLNTMLLTGDCSGNLKVWDIKDYCMNPAKVKPMTPYALEIQNNERSKYAFLWQAIKVRNMHSSQAKFRPPHSCTNPEQTWHAPFLLNCFQGHMLGVTDITLLPSSTEFVSCSLDYSVRLWTIYGEFIGVYGHEAPWKRIILPQDSLKRASESSHHKKPKNGNIVARKLPADIRRVCSSSTLKVLNGGKIQHWGIVKNILMVWLPLFHASRARVRARLQAAKTRAATAKAAATFRKAVTDKASATMVPGAPGVPAPPDSKVSTEKVADKEKHDSDASPSTTLSGSASLQTRSTTNTSSSPRTVASLVRLAKEKEKDRGYIIMEFDLKSKLLGKYYKPHGKHQQLPPLPEIRFFQTKVRAFIRFFTLIYLYSRFPQWMTWRDNIP
jgi:hypothetical protein